jgi:hypothetical protein
MDPAGRVPGPRLPTKLNAAGRRRAEQRLNMTYTRSKDPQRIPVTKPTIRLVRAALAAVLALCSWTAAHAKADGVEYLMVPSRLDGATGIHRDSTPMRVSPASWATRWPTAASSTYVAAGISWASLRPLSTAINGSWSP